MTENEWINMWDAVPVPAEQEQDLWMCSGRLQHQTDLALLLVPVMVEGVEGLFFPRSQAILMVPYAEVGTDEWIRTVGHDFQEQQLYRFVVTGWMFVRKLEEFNERSGATVSATDYAKLLDEAEEVVEDPVIRILRRR